jgi:hypothetical protein
MECVLCQEEMSPHQNVNANLFEPMHRECTLREVMGGIGHLIAHEYWCAYHGDPDAGLTFRQSALLVDLYVHLVGTEVTSSG